MPERRGGRWAPPPAGPPVLPPLPDAQCSSGFTVRCWEGLLRRELRCAHERRFE